MEEIEVTSNRKVFSIFIPKDCDLDICNKVEIRGREFVPVVRCKDCKFCSIHNQWCRRYNKMTSDNWFCADGERKEKKDGLD